MTSVMSSMSSFAELKLQPSTRAEVAKMGITVPTPIQARGIPPLLDGRDLIGQARTGSGKTLAFAIPIVERCDPAVPGVQALVLTPTRELALQVAEVIGKVAAGRRLKLTLLYGGRSFRPEHQALQRGVHIVVGTPGRTLDHLRQQTLALGKLRLFVLDEADEMLDQGFAPDVERILSFTPGSRQTALFSATMPQWVAATAARHTRNAVTVRVDVDNQAPPEIEHIIYQVDAASKLAALQALLDRRGEGSVLVFGRTKHGVKKLALQLSRLGYPIAALQGNLSQGARERVMADFRSGRVPILMATNVAARGIDVNDIETVINYELPETGELFTHRVGRTGRMGRQGTAVALITPGDADKWRQIERTLGRRLAPQPWPYGVLPRTAPQPSVDDRPFEGARGRPRTHSPRAERGPALVGLPQRGQAGREATRAAAASEGDMRLVGRQPRRRQGAAHAAPQQHFSRSRGGRPSSQQKRGLGSVGIISPGV